MSQGARDGGVTMYRMYEQVFAPRQLLLHCPNKLHPCKDAIPALPPSMAVVCHREPGMAVWHGGKNFCIKWYSLTTILV